MVERYNKTLLNMLGTLSDDKKADWKSYVSTMTHAYNAAEHESTGYAPFFLMFGRHPRLAMDAFLGLKQHQDTPCSHQDYVGKLKQRLGYAYDKASKEAKRSADKHKKYYDQKVKFFRLEPGDRVLVRNVGLKGKQKLADIWGKHPSRASQCQTSQSMKYNRRIAKPRANCYTETCSYRSSDCQSHQTRNHEGQSDSNRRVRQEMSMMPTVQVALQNKLMTPVLYQECHSEGVEI